MNLIKKALIGLALVIIGLIAIGIVIGFVDEYNDTRVVNTTPAKVETKQEVKQETKKDDTPVEPTLNKVTQAERAEFMSGCDPDGTMTAYCNCTLDNLEQAIGRDGIIEMANNLGEGEMPEAMLDAAKNCYSKL